MGKVLNFFKKLIPSKRRLIQLYAALLYNANIKGFITGKIFKGDSKMVCVPGMNCYSCPGAIGACPIGSLQAALEDSGSTWPAYVIGIILLQGVIFGRTVCGWLCPAGFLQELTYKIKTPKLKKNRVTRILSFLKYIILGVMVIGIPLAYGLTSTYGIPAFCKYFCPVGTFEGGLFLLSNPNNENLLKSIGGLFSWKFIIMVAVIVASIFIYRVFCRFFCPLGALFGLFNRFSILGFEVIDDKCNNCGICINNCKMDVKKVGDSECIMCGECKKSCPCHAIDTKKILRQIRNERIEEKEPSKLNKVLNIVVPTVMVIALIAVIVVVNFVI